MKNCKNPGSGLMPATVAWFILLAVTAFRALAAAEAVNYDFIQKAPLAKWFRASGPSGSLPWNGPDNDSRGFARHVAGAVLEDGQIYPLVLETHPEWKNDGLIFGVFSNIVVPEKAVFKARVGFLKGAGQSDGAVFEVRVFDQGTAAMHTIASVPAKFDGSLNDISADLAAYAGKTVSFRLQVSAAGRATQDWAVWASAAVTTQVTALKVGQVVEVKRPAAQVSTSQPAPTLTGIQAVRPAMIKNIKLIPAGALPPLHKVEDIGPLPIEEPMTLLNRVYKDNERPNTFYYLPREINLIRDRAAGGYRVSAVWTNDQKVRTTLALQANIDREDVKLMEEALKAARGSAASLKSMPYDQAEIIDMKGWEDWQIENIRIPSFGSLESELPVSISMTPDTLAQLKPLLEKEGLTAGMRIKSGDVEREIPIKVGLKYFTGRMYSGVEELGYSFDEGASRLILHNVRNLTDFPLKVSAVSLRFRLPNGEEVYKNLRCAAETVIPPGEARDLEAAFAPRGLLLAEYRRVFPTPPPPPKKKSALVEKALGFLKEQAEKLDKDKTEEAEKVLAKEGPSSPANAKVDAFFKTYARSFWMDVAPDFDCQPCLEKVWGNIEVVSYIERMRKVAVEVLANVFDPSAYDTPLEVEKVHLDVRSPYLSAQAKSGLVTGLDFNKNKLADAIVVYLPASSTEQFSFEYKVKAVLKTGETAESAAWEKVTDSLDLTLGVVHIKALFNK